MMRVPGLTHMLVLGLITGVCVRDANATALIEPPSLVEQVKAGTLPPVDQRIPAEPSVVDGDGFKHDGCLRLCQTGWLRQAV